jgi:hypothetical protein
MVLNFLKVAAYIKIPALRDTLAKNHVTNMLERFTISAASCIFIVDQPRGLAVRVSDY